MFEVCAHVACHRAWEIPGLVVKPLKMGKASEQRVRDDGAKAWRANLQTEAASARRLHYWIHPGNPAAVEFDTVSVHDAEI